MSDTTRREFLKLGMKTAAVPVGAILLRSELAKAQDLPRLAVDDPTAVALAYVEDATSSTHALYEAGETCANCVQVQGEDGQPWRPCALFPGKSVAAGGWCSVWVQKPG